MKVILDTDTINTLTTHLGDINGMIAEDGGEPLTLSPDRVENLMNSIISQLDEEGINIFEEYDETV